MENKSEDEDEYEYHYTPILGQSAKVAIVIVGIYTVCLGTYLGAAAGLQVSLAIFKCANLYVKELRKKDIDSDQ